jgi:2-haloalkanoic acid dehalogenase type II
LASSNGIQAILFDLDGTLRHNQPDSTDIFLDFAVSLGVPDCANCRRHVARWTHYYWASSPELSQDMQIFRSQSDEFWHHYAGRALLEFGCDEAQVKEIAPAVQRKMNEIYQPLDVVFPDVAPTLQTMKDAGFRLGVLSNRDQPFSDYLTALGLQGYFELILAAGEVKSWKPDPAVFRHAIERMNLEPSQTMYVGDNYYADVEGARNAGLTPVLIDMYGIFPDPGCPVIHKIADLCALMDCPAGPKG